MNKNWLFQSEDLLNTDWIKIKKIVNKFSKLWNLQRFSAGTLNWKLGIKMEIQENKIEIANFKEMRLENNKILTKPNNY